MSEEKSHRQRHNEERAFVGSKRPYVGKAVTVREDFLEFPDGRKGKWEIVERPDAVVVLPILPDNTLILIKQFRRPTNKILLELPAGLLNNGETDEEAAQRELREETGYAATQLLPFGNMFSAPGFCQERLYFFVAQGLEYNPLPHDEDEAIDVVNLSLEEALRLVDSGEIIDAKSIAGILKYERSLKK